MKSLIFKKPHASSGAAHLPPGGPRVTAWHGGKKPHPRETSKKPRAPGERAALSGGDGFGRRDRLRDGFGHCEQGTQTAKRDPRRRARCRLPESPGTSIGIVRAERSRPVDAPDVDVVAI